MASAAADPSSPIDAEARGKRPVWNVPSNGSIEVGSIMGAVAWPALSEAAKASPKSLPLDSSKPPPSDASPPSPTGNPQGPQVSSPTLKPVASPPSPNPMSPVRQKSFKRGGGGDSGNRLQANGGVSPPSPFAVPAENARNVPDKQVVPEPSPRGSRPGGGPAPHHHNGPDQHRGYGGNRRGGNSGGGPHQSYGGRRDQDWNHPRGGAHLQHPRGGIRTYPRPPPPPVSAPFAPPPPPPLRPFVGNAVSFPDMHSPMYFVAPQPPPESLRGMPFVPQPIPHPMFFSAMDPQRALLLKQIDYYFSSDNLCRDVYLRQNMDEQGWVPVSLIAGFNRVKQLTNNIQYILETVRFSTLVEVQSDKLRRRNDWMNWLLVPSQRNNTSDPLSPKKTNEYDSMATRLQKVRLEGSGGHPEMLLTRSASGNLNNQFQISGDQSGSGGGAIGQLTGLSDSGWSKSSRSLSRSDTL